MGIRGEAGPLPHTISPHLQPVRRVYAGAPDSETGVRAAQQHVHTKRIHRHVSRYTRMHVHD